MLYDLLCAQVFVVQISLREEDTDEKEKEEEEEELCVLCDDC